MASYSILRGSDEAGTISPTASLIHSLSHVTTYGSDEAGTISPTVLLIPSLSHVTTYGSDVAGANSDPATTTIITIIRTPLTCHHYIPLP